MRQLFFTPSNLTLNLNADKSGKLSCILPGLRLLGHAAGTSLGFMFRVGTGSLQQTLCIILIKFLDR